MKTEKLLQNSVVAALALIVSFGIFTGCKGKSKNEFTGIVSLPGNVRLEMVRIKAGTFLMGSPTTESYREDDETQHRVTLTHDYWLGKYEVTQAQYEALMGSNPSGFKGPDWPVEEVSWGDAMEFCRKLNAQYAGKLPDGYEFGLPTEAQWEYACRAGTMTALNSGKNLMDEKYNCPNLNDVGWYGWQKGETTIHPVGQKKPNAWGLYDMHGNVWEWCRDWYGSYGGDATDPAGPATGSSRVNRGGSFFNYARYCRSATRSRNGPTMRLGLLGFRLALVPAADQGLVQAQRDPIHSYQNAEESAFGGNQDMTEAEKMMLEAADQGNAAAQFRLAYCYENGLGVTQNYAEAVKWYRKAAEQGVAEAQLNLGFCYHDGEGVEKDLTEAVKWFRKAADQGVTLAQFNLAVCYHNGDGVEQDLSEAAKWVRKAADQGDAEAQFFLALCYKNGEGVKQDDAEAVKWYRKAAEQGYADAQYELGKCYYNGDGVEQNKAEAVKWFRKVADQGDANAQFNLALCYGTGEGVEQDYAEAAKWCRKAADQGDAEAQFNLGLCYANGCGVKQDDTEAVKWFRKAAEQGHELAKEALKDLGD